MKIILKNPSISIKPSKILINHINNLKSYSDMPPAIKNIRFRQSKFDVESKPTKHDTVISDKDRNFIKTLNLKPTTLNMPTEDTKINDHNILLKFDDLFWLWNKIQEGTNKDKEKPYLHELLMGSEIILPQNADIPRSEELDKRCNLLKIQQENREYKAITKNVDTVRKLHPEDTISYQMKQINKQLIAVAQFIISVLAGFLFGFHGIELMVGSLDFGFRLLLGVICSLTIALAELYFLAKKLNEDLQYEIQVENKTVHSKID